jgi:hypothetical protein
MKRVFWCCLQLLSETLLITKRTELDIVINFLYKDYIYVYLYINNQLKYVGVVNSVVWLHIYYFNVNFNVNFKIVFKTILLCFSW